MKDLIAFNSFLSAIAIWITKFHFRSVQNEIVHSFSKLITFFIVD